MIERRTFQYRNIVGACKLTDNIEQEKKRNEIIPQNLKQTVIKIERKSIMDILTIETGSNKPVQRILAKVRYQ